MSDKVMLVPDVTAHIFMMLPSGISCDSCTHTSTHTNTRARTHTRWYMISDGNEAGKNARASGPRYVSGASGASSGPLVAHLHDHAGSAHTHRALSRFIITFESWAAHTSP
jgi:hypothetical protein